MRKKSTKLAKLEKNRYSIFTDDYKRCYYCKKYAKTDIHEVYRAEVIDKEV
jgi:PP-loop superfamily ATP-utilizing enzyme